MNAGARASFALVLSCSLLVACAADGRRSGVGGGGMDAGTDPMDSATTDLDGGTPMIDVGQGPDPVIDPFDPDASCGSAAIPSVRVPGSLLLVFDRSSSMDNSPGDEMSTDPSKWETATDAINETLTALPDELSMGLMLFPTPGSGDGCSVDPTPQVPVAPLSTSRSMIESVLNSSPNGGTPLIDALRQGWSHLDGLATTGLRGLILVTDGGESCDSRSLDMVLAEAEQQRLTKGYRTYAVGLDQANNFLSTLAIQGGTRKNDMCLAECTSRSCFSAADCPGAAGCLQFIPTEPGRCQCTNNAECVAPQTCLVLPIIGGNCLGTANCCHYDAESSNFEADFRAALSDIAERFLDSCVFEVPMPEGFDPALVNVGVTFEGEARMTLPFSMNADVNSWQYVDESNESLIIQGPICDQLLANPATVEIVVGCQTILI